MAKKYKLKGTEEVESEVVEVVEPKKKLSEAALKQRSEAGLNSMKNKMKAEAKKELELDILRRENEELKEVIKGLKGGPKAPKPQKQVEPSRYELFRNLLS